MTWRYNQGKCQPAPKRKMSMEETIRWAVDALDSPMDRSLIADRLKEALQAAPPREPDAVRYELADLLKRQGFTSRDGTIINGGTLGVIDTILAALRAIPDGRARVVGAGDLVQFLLRQLDGPMPRTTEILAKELTRSLLQSFELTEHSPMTHDSSASAAREALADEGEKLVSGQAGYMDVVGAFRFIKKAVAALRPIPDGAAGEPDLTGAIIKIGDDVRAKQVADYLGFEGIDAEDVAYIRRIVGAALHPATPPSDERAKMLEDALKAVRFNLIHAGYSPNSIMIEGIDKALSPTDAPAAERESDEGLPTAEDVRGIIPLSPSSASDALELQSCPFCGSDAHFYENEVDFVPKWSVRCSECSSDMDVCEDEKHDAAMAWNTRAACPSPAANADEFFDMLWAWFEDEGRIGAEGMRPERRDGLSADDFKTMLDEHEAALTDEITRLRSELDQARGMVERLKAALEDARLQLEYVQEKHGYATGETVLARIRAALSSTERNDG